jgi:muramoyltetrapeptide carboxypeptidase
MPSSVHAADTDYNGSSTTYRPSPSPSSVSATSRRCTNGPLSAASLPSTVSCKHIATLPEDSEPILALRQLLTGHTNRYTWAPHPLNRPGKACAPVVGGNLSVLYGLQGTPFALGKLSYKFPILLIEDISERHYHIDRMMRNLRMSGVLAHLSGLIVGRFTDCEDDPLMSCSVYETIKEAVADYDYPIIFNAPIGHVEHNLPLLLNRPSAIDSGMNSVLLTNGFDINIAD